MLPAATAATAVNRAPVPNPSHAVPVPPPQPHKLQVNKGRHHGRRQDAHDDEEVPRQTGLRLKLDVVVAHGPAALVPPLVLPLVRPRVSPPVKVRHVVVGPARAEGAGPGAHATRRLVEVLPRVSSRRRGGRGSGRLLVGLAPLVGVRAPAAAPVEARRGAAEGPSALGEARGRAAAGVVLVLMLVGGGAVVGAGGRGGVVMVMRVVQAQDVAVVLGAAGGVGEDVVGFGEEGEVLGGAGRGVHVRVVRLGEQVEGPAGWLFVSGWPFASCLLDVGSWRGRGRGAQLFDFAGRGIVVDAQALVVILLGKVGCSGEGGVEPAQVSGGGCAVQS